MKLIRDHQPYQLVAQVDEIFHHPDNRNIAQQCARGAVTLMRRFYLDAGDNEDDYVALS